MRIGNLHITWLSSRTEQILRVEIREELRSQDVRNSILRLARSETKNYLAYLAEEVEMPFSDPGSFLAWVRASVATAGANELKHRIFDTPEEREETEKNLKLVDDALGDDPHSVIRSLKLAEYPFEVGGYANHPEQEVYDSEPFPPEEHIVRGEG